jgi:molybdopterin converting factor small subunit
MSVKVHLYSRLPSFAGNRNIVEVEGETVGQCVNNLVAQFPDLKPIILDEQGKPWATIYLSVNLNSPHSEPMTRMLTDQDELYIILIAAGG